MRLKNKVRVFAIVTLILLTTSAAASRPRKMQRVTSGSWGGPHIRLEVESSSATVNYDCAHGTITGPLTFDSKGRFTWKGTHQREGPGPIRVNRPPTDQKVIYSGTVNGKTMTLTVKFAESGETLDTFTLQLGSAGRVFKCK
jgi:hypothetical protein